MGDIGVPELLIILAIALAIFGPGRIAGLGKALGTSIKEFRNSMQDGDTGTAEEQRSGAPEELATKS